jgi:hypothetical protein
MNIGEQNKQEMRIGDRCTAIKKGDRSLFFRFCHCEERIELVIARSGLNLSLRGAQRRGNLLEMIVIARTMNWREGSLLLSLRAKRGNPINKTIFTRKKNDNTEL